MKILKLLVLINLLFLFSCTRKPDACFNYTVNKDSILFNASCSSDGKQFLWDFGDCPKHEQDIGVGEILSHKFKNPGEYTVKLEVSSEGLVDSTSQRIKVK